MTETTRSKDPTLRLHRFGAACALLTMLVATACGGSSAAKSSATTAPAVSASPTVVTAKYSGGKTDSFDLAGAVLRPASYRIANLQSLPETQVTTNAQAGAGMLGEHTYAGPLLFDLVSAAQLKVDDKSKNDVLRKAIIVTGSDGYRAAISWGEIDPKYGAKKVLVAYEQDGQPLPENDGFARLIVPGDVAAGRYISNVYRIDVVDAEPPATQGQRKPTTSFQLGGAVATPGEITLTKLQALPQTQVTIDSNGTKSVYGGVLLNDLLKSGGIKIDASKKNDILTKGIGLIGVDGYTSLVVGGEIDAKFGNIQVLVATTKDGKPLDDTDGFARLVVPGDIAAGRFVSNLQKIDVVQF